MLGRHARLLTLALVFTLLSVPLQAALTATIPGTTMTVTFEKIMVTISQVEVQDAAGGWITVMSTPTTFDLLEIQNIQRLLGSFELKSGEYTKIRMTRDKVVVYIGGQQRDSGLPAQVIEIPKTFSVDVGGKTKLSLDFDPQKMIAPYLHAPGTPTPAIAMDSVRVLQI